MIRRCAKLDEFERRQLLREDISYINALRIFESLCKEAVSLGVFCSENILVGLEVDFRIARAINGLPK